MLQGLRAFLYSNFYDKRFETNKGQYVIQCLLATLVIFIVLMMLNIISSELIIASIASSAFVVFTMPHKDRSRARFLIGGYAVGLLIGILIYSLSLFFIKCCPEYTGFRDEIFGSIAVGLSIFCMVVFDLEHPPAAAVALAMIINHWNCWTIIVTVVAVSLLVVARYALSHRLINLL